jgi:hypothetical protein
MNVNIPTRKRVIVIDNNASLLYNFVKVGKYRLSQTNKKEGTNPMIKE